MDNKFSILFNKIPEGWKFFGAVTGFGSVIWFAAITFDHWQDKGLDQANVIEYLQKSNHNQELYNKMKDSIDIIKWDKLNKRLGFISDSLRLSITNQQTLVNAVGTIGSKVTNTVPELFKLMGGLQFELIQSEVMKSVFPETKIKIIKSDTIKNKK